MKKIFIVMMAAIVASSVLTGCAAKKQQGANVSTGNDANQPVVEITAMLESHASWPFNQDWYALKLLEEKTKVKLNVTSVTGANYKEKLNITIASKNLPDIIHMIAKPDEINKYGAQGALLDYKPNMKNMPNFQKWTEKYPQDYQSALTADGKLYILPGEGIGEGNRRGWLFREDLFKKHNIAIPKNSEELYQALVTLKKAYPDSYPFAWRGGLKSMVDMIAPLWATGHKAYFDEDKKEWRYGPVENNYKEFVTFVNRLYKEKLIPPDLLTLEVGPWQTLISTNKVFVTIDYLTRIDSFNAAMRKENKDFSLAYMTPPAMGTNGKQKFTYSPSISNALTISSTNKNVDRTLKMFDYFYSEEGRDVMSWGKEGETYKVENGQKKWIDVTDAAGIRNKYGLSTYGFYTWFNYDAHKVTFTPELNKAYEESKKYDEAKDPAPAFTEAEYEQYTQLEAAINKHREENIAKFILGTRPMSEWDKYIEEAKKLGVDQFVQLYKTAYDRMLKMAK
jgi:putative aldouronate transport system substrate-binding protein